MTGKQSPLQELFLNQARREKVPVTIFLTNGFQIRGIVRAFDNFTVLLDVDGKQELVYKHALSTVIPARTINLEEQECRSDLQK